MLVKDMQAEEGSKGTEDHSVHISPIDKSTNKQANRIEGAAVKEALHNGNGIQDIGDESSDKQSSDSKSHGSPAAEQEMTSMQSHDMAQPLNFELDSEAQSDVSGRNFWQLPHHEDGNMFRFQSINPPQSMPNYGLNNNNSFPQPVHFGSIGQPTNYMPNHGHFSSPPGMHNMSMMSNMGPMGGMNYPNSHSQNQRRAITAQHNYGSMGGKPMNPRVPWSNQQNTWPNPGQPPNMSPSMSPWTMALQQQKAMNRPGGNANMGPGSKKGQSGIPINHSASMNNMMMQQLRYGKRSSPVSSMKAGYPVSVGGESISTSDMSTNYQVNTK